MRFVAGKPARGLKGRSQGHPTIPTKTTKSLRKSALLSNLPTIARNDAIPAAFLTKKKIRLKKENTPGIPKNIDRWRAA